MNGSDLIRDERERQITGEGWTAEHDDRRVCAELTDAARLYALVAALQIRRTPLPNLDCVPDGWPWQKEWWKPSPDTVRNLVKAGALIAAEIDRLLRQEGARGETPADALTVHARNITEETLRAMVLFPSMHSLHEAHSVILEEFEEFWEEAKINPAKLGDTQRRERLESIRSELTQTAAMCLRALVDLDL